MSSSTNGYYLQLTETLIVMEHKIKYTIEEKEYYLSSTLYREGTDETHNGNERISRFAIYHLHQT